MRYADQINYILALDKRATTGDYKFLELGFELQLLNQEKENEKLMMTLRKLCFLTFE